MNDSKKNWESLNAQGVVDFAHWMIDQQGVRRELIICRCDIRFWHRASR